jgi:hypothetical protein
MMIATSPESPFRGVGAGIKFSTFCNYVAAIENSLIDPACRTTITPPAARRHHIGKMKFKVTNWAEYEAGVDFRAKSIMFFVG